MDKQKNTDTVRDLMTAKEEAEEKLRQLSLDELAQVTGGGGIEWMC